MEDQLTKLLKEVELAHEKSRIKQYADEKGVNWNYELIISALEEKQPLIVGFNPGVDSDWKEYQIGNEYKPQSSVYPRKFLEIYKGSIQRIIPYVEKYYPDQPLDRANHSNLCFFRSANEDQIHYSDVELCKPIFDKLLDIIDPSIVFCFSKQLKEHMVKSGVVENFSEKWIKPENGKRSCAVATAKLKNGTNVVFMPHPNNWRFVKKDAIDKAWVHAASNG